MTTRIPPRHPLHFWCGVSSCLLLIALSTSTVALGGKKHSAMLRIESVPAGALVTVRETREIAAIAGRTAAGKTPLEKTFDFGKAGRLWIEVEKRGYAPVVKEVTKDSQHVIITLERIAGPAESETTEFSLSAISKVALSIPEIEVIERGFSRESVSVELSAAAKRAVAESIRLFFSGVPEVVEVEQSEELEAKALKSLWRDSRTAMELLDPIRLAYLAEAPVLETRAGRSAALEVGGASGADVVLLITGKQNRETGGMKAGKIGLTAAGTAASYGSAYSSAVSSGDSFFVYNVYLPSFAQGTILKAALVNCSSGEVLWVNKGVWGMVDFSNPREVGEVISDLLRGLHRQSSEPNEIHEEVKK